MVERAAVNDYLRAPESAFWRWDQDAQVVSWCDNGDTIAFRPELAQIIEILVESGVQLPALGPLLLLIAACRGTWQQRDWDDHYWRILADDVALGSDDVARLKANLDRVAQFNPEITGTVEGKAQLAASIFAAGQAHWTPSQVEAICDILMARRALDPWFRARSRRVTDADREGFRTLAGGLKQLDVVEKLQLRIRTGLDELPAPAEVEVKQLAETRELISSLLDDPAYGGLARLARALMAVVHLPRPLLEPEELPMGGFSDIQNRGSVDRLLVSELAHDDLTLAVRIALNEALYLRRESPPKTPSLTRSVLVDVGIRSWGVNRVFATAAALALAATADRHTQATVYRANGTEVENVDLTTRTGLAEHLSCLTADVHPGRALGRFLQESSPLGRRADCVVVTSVEAAHDPRFTSYLSRQSGENVYLATVGQRGDFQLCHLTPYGRKVLCEASLKLDEILSAPAAASVVDPNHLASLHAAFRQPQFPLRVPCNRFREEASWLAGRSVLELAIDGRLLCWDRRRSGPRQLAEHVPGDMPFRWGGFCEVSETAMAVFGDGRRPYQLLSVAGHTGAIAQAPLQLANSIRPDAFFTDQGMLMAVTPQDVIVLDLAGQFVNHVPCTGESEGVVRPLTYSSGKLFKNEVTGAWYEFSFSANEQFTQVFDPAVHPDVKPVVMYTPPGHEGPVGLTEDGQFYYPEEKRSELIRPALGRIQRLLEVEPSGRWVLVEGTNPPAQRWAISGEAQLVPPDKSLRWLSDCGSVSPASYPVHSRFSGIAIGQDGHSLVLVSNKGMAWVLELRGGELCLVRNAYSAAKLNHPVHRFSRSIDMPSGKIQVQLTEASDDWTAILDSRGLLHLTCGSSLAGKFLAGVGIVDTTIVLCDGQVAGWCADGRQWGNPYYCDADTRTRADEIVEEVIVPFIGLMT